MYRSRQCASVVALLTCAACGPSGSTQPANGADARRGGMPADAGKGSGSGSNGSGGADGGMTSPDAGATGGPITCPGPGNPKNNGGSCGTERWNIKVGTDSQAPGVSLVPQPNTIAALDALPAAGGGTHRESPTETTLWELKNVTLTELKLESDSDYHLVIADGTHTMIAEIPSPTCATTSPWACFISRARSEIDAMYTVTTSPQYPAATITLRGVGFFDILHGQTGVAPNAIELHPVLQICFGMNCTPS